MVEGTRPDGGARAAVLPFPPERPHAVRERRRLPAVVIVLLVVLLAAGGGAGVYVAARTTTMFALQTIEVRGATPRVAARVERALSPLVGTSLVGFDRDEAVRRLGALPEIAGASFDRNFPHTLRVFVHAEQAVAVLRRGRDAWLLSSRGRIMRLLLARPYPRLPRIWVTRAVGVSVGATLGGEAAEAVRVAALLQALRFPADVRFVRVAGGGTALGLRSGREVRLGDAGDLRLKLAIARRILPLTRGAAYVDVSVPERSVAGYNPQVEG